MSSVHSLEEAAALIHQHFPFAPPPPETLPLTEVPGRVLAADITAAEDVPGFTRSTMDGYAVQARDTFGASEAMPAMLAQVGEVVMGEAPGFVVGPGQCAYIPTGGALPQGADSVAMVEHTSHMPDGTVFVESPLSPGNHLVFRGDDVKAGQVVLAAGTRLRAQDIGTLAALGHAQVPVCRQPRVGILSTGDELVPVEAPAAGAVVRDVNTHTLAAAIHTLGALAVPYGIIADSWDTLQTALTRALQECDMVLISGGSSMGTMDMTHRLIDAAGAPGVFIHGVAVKPGKPTIVGSAGGTPVFGLPGHPVSAFLIFQLLAAPVLARLCGMPQRQVPTLPAVLAGKIPSGGGREEYVPVALRFGENGPTATPLRYKSGLISTLAATDGFAHVPRNREGFEPGDTVQVLLFE